ncbi:MAG: aminoacyl-tRNA hydrolase [Candidatus Limnocylindria bacterium]
MRLRRLFGGERPRADRLVVGLGNPGDGYAATRHNVGFQVVARLAKRARLEFGTKAVDSRIAEGMLGGVRVAIARPHTFMNNSGKAVGKLLDRYGLEPKDLIVVYDDVDLPLGRIRVRPKGGPGTHNGMRSVVGEIGEGFPRVRCGVAPGDTDTEMPRDLADYVLLPFDADERGAAEAMVGRAAEAIEVAVRDGLEPAMARWNAGEAK